MFIIEEVYVCARACTRVLMCVYVFVGIDIGGLRKVYFSISLCLIPLKWAFFSLNLKNHHFVEVGWPVSSQDPPVYNPYYWSYRVP